jgi:phage shock protein PspC (stress-responsive transcriptional regulator)
MKKVVNINFQGRIITIEESAFEQLQDYIQSLRNYFQQEEGRDEIINDIENRIAEIFEQEIKNGTVCITDDKLQSVINEMGRVEDFEKMDQDHATTTSPKREEIKEPKAALFRNINDKIIGGVCSGIAHALRIDSAVVRVLFALLTLGGGSGILIYLILWIVLPKKTLETPVQKKLYRDQDHKVIAGIGSGIAAYFNIPVWIPRIIFLMPIISGLFSGAFGQLIIFTGGFGGTLFLTYIILWIILPVAKTPTEKMQMRGEKIDVQAIRSAVKDEMEGIQDRLNAAGKKIQSGAERMGKEAEETAARISKNVGTHTDTTTGRILYTIGIIFKVVFWLIAGIVSFLFIILLSGLSIAGIAVYPLVDFIFSEKLQYVAYWGTILFFIFTPAVGLLIRMIRKITGVRRKTNYLTYTFVTLWTIGWVCLFYLISSLSKDFSRKSQTSFSMNLGSRSDSVLLITSSQPIVKYSGYYSWMKSDEDGFDITNDSVFYPNVHLKIEKAPDSIPAVLIKKSSYARNKKEAEEKTKNILFNVEYKGNMVDINHTLGIAKKDHFRGQKVEVNLLLPVGSRIIFDDKLISRLNSFTLIKDNDDDDDDFGFNIELDDFIYKPGVIYIMTEKGLQQEGISAIPSKPESFQTAKSPIAKNQADLTESSARDKNRKITFFKQSKSDIHDGSNFPLNVFIF